jgi:lipoprotein
VTSRQPQWSCMFGALFRLLMVGGFAIACSYVSDADPWKAVVGPLLRFAGSWGLQILTLVDHAVVMVLGALLARGSLRSLAEGGKIHLEGMSRFGTRPGWTLKAQFIGADPREQPGWATAPSIFAYRRALFRFYLGQVRVLITCVYVTFLMFVIASA